MSSFNVLNEDAEEEDLGKVVVQTPKSILKPIRFGQQKNIYKQQQLRRKRASSYTRVSFDSIPIIHEFVVSDAEKEAKRAADDEKIFKAAAWSASRLDKSKYIVYDDDDSLGKQAPSIDNLVYHKGDKISYSGAKFTVVGFWGKFAKGDYSTLNSWSHLERKYRSKGVQFLGVSRDRKEGDVVKFVGRLGTFMRELGERGITLGATFPLAFDPDTKVGEEFRTLSGLMSLAVGMAYVVDASGKILWREQFSRGAAPANQLEAQLDLLTSGKSVALTNGNEPDEDDEEDDDGEGTVQGISIVAAGADY